MEEKKPVIGISIKNLKEYSYEELKAKLEINLAQREEIRDLLKLRIQTEEKLWKR